MTEKRLIRGSSVTSLYSQEKERKSVHIRRSRSRTFEQGKRELSAPASGDDQTHKSLERMYTFNLSTFDKQTKLKQKLKEKERKGALRDKIDGPLVQAKSKEEEKPDIVSKPEEPIEERPETRKVLTNSKSASSFSQTFQVLEKTNIQEKQLIGA